MSKIAGLLLAATAVLHACRGAEPFDPVVATGGLQVSTATMGADLDPDGYRASVDGGPSELVATNGVFIIARLPAGDHLVALEGVASNCAVDGANPVTVSVTAHAATEVAFRITCTAVFGIVEVTVATTGGDPSSSDYTVQIGHVCEYVSDDDFDCYYAWQAGVNANGTARLSAIPVGEHLVQLAVARNCAVVGENPRTASVPPGDKVVVVFAVTCEPLGSVRVTVASSGSDVDPNGYDVRVRGAGDYAYGHVGVLGTVTISQLLADEYTVTLLDVSQNCTVSEQNPLTVPVPGATVDVAFTVTCAPWADVAGSVEVTLASNWTGDLGVWASVDGGLGEAFGMNRTVTIRRLLVGSHALTLGGYRITVGQCQVGPPNPRGVLITAGQTVTVTLELTCHSGGVEQGGPEVSRSPANGQHTLAVMQLAP